MASLRHHRLVFLFVGLVCAAALLAGSQTLAGQEDFANEHFIYSSDDKLHFDLDAFLEENDPEMWPHRVALRHLAARFTVSPRVLVCLAQLAPEETRGPDADMPAWLEATARRLSVEYYAHRDSSGVIGATAARESLREFLISAEESAQRYAAFLDLFDGYFPGLRARRTSGLALDTKMAPPEDLLQLPFPVGDAWQFGGTHTFAGPDPGVHSSLDFFRAVVPWNSDTSQEWVVASHPGTVVVHSSCFVEILGPDGWSTSYYHLGNVQVSQGQSIARNQRLANYSGNLPQALCDGGQSEFPHVHFSLRRNGQYVPVQDVLLSGFMVQRGRFAYDRDCSFFWFERQGSRLCSPGPALNEGVRFTPRAPDGLTVTPISNQVLRLTWNDLSSNETGFEVERRGASGSFQTIATPGAGAREILDGSLISGTEYIYRVRAVNDVGPSDYGPEATATTLGERPPDQLQASALSGTEVRLTWRDNSGSEERFEIDRRPAGGGFSVAATAVANSQEAVLGGHSPGTTFVYRLRAVGPTGASTNSAEVSVTTRSELAPEGLNAVPRSSSAILLSWADRATGEDGYEVEVRGPENTAEARFFPANTEEALIDGLDPGSEYAFRVRATGGEGTSPFSGEVRASTFQAEAGECLPGPGVICLNEDRFRAEIVWQDFEGQNGSGILAPQRSDDSALFYFFDPNNWELLLKVLDGCAINDHFWVFAAATTNVGYTLTVTDTWTGFTAVYSNPLGVSAPATTDAEAFRTCAATPP